MADCSIGQLNNLAELTFRLEPGLQTDNFLAGGVLESHRRDRGLFCSETRGCYQAESTKDDLGSNHDGVIGPGALRT